MPHISCWDLREINKININKVYRYTGVHFTLKVCNQFIIKPLNIWRNNMSAPKIAICINKLTVLVCTYHELLLNTSSMSTNSSWTLIQKSLTKIICSETNYLKLTVVHSIPTNLNKTSFHGLYDWFDLKRKF